MASHGRLCHFSARLLQRALPLCEPQGGRHNKRVQCLFRLHSRRRVLVRRPLQNRNNRARYAAGKLVHHTIAARTD